MPSHHLNQCWNIVNSNLRYKLQWNPKRNSCIFIQENAFKNVVCEMVAILSLPQWVNPCCHYSHAIMSMMASQITRILIGLLNPLFRRRSKKTSKLCLTGLCEGNPLVTSGFPSQRASNVEKVSIWWHHHDDEFISGNLKCIWHR